MLSSGTIAEQLYKVTGYEPELNHGYISLSIPSGHWIRCLGLLRNRLDFQVFTDLVVVDRPGQKKRFAVIALVTNLPLRVTVGVQTEVREGAPLDSLSKVYPSSISFENETSEMFGITFQGHAAQALFLPSGDKTTPLKKV